jgi:hypothetical protein
MKNKKTYFTNEKKCKAEVFMDAPVCSHAPVSVHTELRRPDRPMPPGPGPTPPDPSPTPPDPPPYKPRPRRDITDVEPPPPPPRRDITDLPDDEPPQPPPPRRKGLNDASLTTGEIIGLTAGTIATAGALAYGASVATGSAEIAEGAGEIEMMEAGGAGLSEAEFASMYGGASATGLEGARRRGGGRRGGPRRRGGWSRRRGGWSRRRGNGCIGNFGITRT